MDQATPVYPTETPEATATPVGDGTGGSELAQELVARLIEIIIAVLKAVLEAHTYLTGVLF